MRTIISPAKKMNTDTDSLPWLGLPCHLDRTRAILSLMRSMSFEELQKLWKCNEQIAKLNYQRIQNIDLEKQLTPAILAYEGIQYQYMAPNVFTNDEFDYIQEHLRILSGFYGILRPFDGVVPYRLEMQAKLKISGFNDLYSFWGTLLADTLSSETDCIIDLASKEYSQAVIKHLPSSCNVISCVFGEKTNGKIVEKGTMCKMARGEMVRFMAENKIHKPETLKNFDRLRYNFSEEDSDENKYVFIKNKEAPF